MAGKRQSTASEATARKIAKAVSSRGRNATKTFKAIDIQQYSFLSSFQELSPLLSLPTEILSNITCHLPPEALVCLMLTSHLSYYRISSLYPSIPTPKDVKRKLAWIMSHDHLSPNKQICYECGIWRPVTPSTKANWYLSPAQKKVITLTTDSMGLVNEKWLVQLAPPASSSSVLKNADLRISTPKISKTVCPDCTLMVYKRSKAYKQTQDARYESVAAFKASMRSKLKEQKEEMHFILWLQRQEDKYRKHFKSLKTILQEHEKRQDEVQIKPEPNIHQLPSGKVSTGPKGERSFFVIDDEGEVQVEKREERKQMI